LHLGTVLSLLFTGYAAAVAVFLVSENRRPQSTLAWLAALIVVPVLGLPAYVLFGRGRRAFSRRRVLLMQTLEPTVLPIIAPVLESQKRTIAQLEGESAAHRRLINLARRNSASLLTRENRVDVLQDAEAFYGRLLEDMRAARHSIHHQYYIWRTDSFGQALKDLLVAKAADGVEVRVLFDPVGSLADLRPSYFKALRKGGVKVAPTSSLGAVHTLSYRNHRKITVIDGAVGYTGGMNIGQEQLDGGPGFTEWRDTQVRMAGEAAAMLQTVFSVDWYNSTRENLFSPIYFPEIPDVPDKDEVPVQILTSGPDSHWAAIRQVYVAMILSAERQVLVQSPFFVPNATVADALRQAALAGVDVRLMVSARASGNKMPEWATNTYLTEMVEAGVKVLLYERGYLHAKTIVMDEKVCSIGSTNIDIRSFSINYELNAVIYDRSIAGALAEDFARDEAFCRGFSVDEYQARSPLLRFRDSTARLFSPLL